MSQTKLEPTNSGLAERVTEDSELSPAEKETTITFGKPDDTAWVFTAEAGLMRRLLHHPLFRLRYIVRKSGGRVENVEEINVAELEIVGLGGAIPVGALKIRANEREQSGHASVVTYR